MVGQYLEESMYSDEVDYSVLRGLTWTGPFLMVVLFVAMASINFLPPPSPASSADEIASMFKENQISIVAACVVMMFGWLCWATYCPAIMVMVRKTEPALPAITYSSIALIGASTAFFLLAPLTWAVIAFRAAPLEPEIIRLANDFAWFNFLFSVPPFLVWFGLVGIAIFKDRNTPTIFPRWAGYANLWMAILGIPACLIGFFKTGPFAWDGVGAFWIPLGAFALWVPSMTYATLRAIKNEENKIETGEGSST